MLADNQTAVACPTLQHDTRLGQPGTAGKELYRRCSDWIGVVKQLLPHVPDGPGWKVVLYIQAIHVLADNQTAVACPTLQHDTRLGQPGTAGKELYRRCSDWIGW